MKGHNHLVNVVFRQDSTHQKSSRDLMKLTRFCRKLRIVNNFSKNKEDLRGQG